ncbi:prolyl 4-hydroxylase subunit alpha-3-like [Argopecten irradians]|uniref:prolyl 4-hydroxylase subunit alpha-3-like n=1 Tax=Argopecten irradians TaxID=31199 RepID=UPI003714B2E0
MSVVMYAVMTALLFTRVVKANIYSSTREVQFVARKELRMLVLLDDYVTSEQNLGNNVSQDILTFFSHMRDVRVPHITNTEFGDNPIIAFHLLQRVLIEWDRIIDMICCESCLDKATVRQFRKGILRIHSGDRLPVTSEDIQGAAEAILRLWQTYELDLDKLMSGVIYDSKSEPLTSSDAMYISEFAKRYQKIVWLEKLLERYNVSEEEDMWIKSALAKEYSEFGMPWKSAEIIEPFLHLDNKSIKADYHLYMSLSYRIPVHSKVLEPEEESERNSTYRALCRGETRTARQLSSLKCYLRPTSFPYYRSKEEVMNNVPRLSIFHDVISTSEMAQIRASGARVMTRSTVWVKNESVVKDTRVSYTGWLHDIRTENNFLLKLNRRIGLITGLDTTFRKRRSSVEQYQVLNYGIGGCYTPHLDVLDIPLWGPTPKDVSPEIRESGERIATWMFYLSTVKAGGATVFPNLGARVPAVEGAAAFWYNLLPNGDKDERMGHAGCPVLLGSKWVVNKWIRQEGQVLTKLCGRTREAEFQYDIDID